MWLPNFLLQSYANAILSSFEDPEKILEQAVLEMNDDLVKMRQATAQVSHMILHFIEIALVILSFNWRFISSALSFTISYLLWQIWSRRCIIYVEDNSIFNCTIK